MADGFGRVEVAAEVAAFEGKVGGDKDFGAGGRAEDGAVVAYAKGDDLLLAMWKIAANLLDQGEFAERFWEFFHAKVKDTSW